MMNMHQKLDANIDKIKQSLTSKGYTLGKKLGEGGYAAAFVAKDDKRRRDVACKIVDRSKNKEWAKVGLVAEPETASLFNQHPNVVKVYEAFKSPMFMFTVMEYMSGGSLENRIYPWKVDPSVQRKYRHPIEINQSITWFCHIASALHYIHSKSYAHRDIKPDNILIDVADNAKLADFGFVTKTVDLGGQRKLSATQCGTEVYKSPEMSNGPYDAQLADIYALGITLYEMVIGALPFSDHKMVSFKKKGLKKKSHHFRRGEPEEVQLLIEKMIEPDPQKRINSPDVIRYIASHLLKIF